MSQVIRLLADKNIPLPEEMVPGSVSVTSFDPAEGIPGSVDEFDALFVRTISPIDRTTIPEHPSNLRFIGSATAGFDHVDHNWLEAQGIEFACSPGCNADSVGEYIGTAVMIWSLNTGSDLTSLTAGIVGAGNTGMAVTAILEKMGLRVNHYDPPREEWDPHFKGTSIQEILESDILTFHTPLTRGDIWPTRHWLDRSKLENNKFSLILNAARGGVIDDQALEQARQKGSVGDYILDVWENEPLFFDRTAAGAFLSTPHIAGYSVQAKRRASEMVLKALCRYFDLPELQGVTELQERPEQQGRTGAPDQSEIPVRYEASGWTEQYEPAEKTFRTAGNRNETELPGQSELFQMLRRLNPICEYHRRFKALIGLEHNNKSRAFQKLRTGFPLRDEHPWVTVSPGVLKKFPELKSLGFRSC